MNSTQARAISNAAVTSAVAQMGFAVQQRQLALERYVAAIAGDRPSQRHTSIPRQAVPGPASKAPQAAEPTVSSVMLASSATVLSTSSFTGVLRALAAHARSAIPVVDHNGMVVGMVSEADLLAHVVTCESDELNGLTAADLMSSPAITTTPDATITRAAAVAAHAHLKVLPVIDAIGRVVGMLSRADILGTYLHEAGNE